MMSNYVTSNFGDLTIVSAVSQAATSTLHITGIVDVTAAIPSFNPHLGFSAAPTTSIILAKSYMHIYPVPLAEGGDTIVGTWIAA